MILSIQRMCSLSAVWRSSAVSWAGDKVCRLVLHDRMGPLRWQWKAADAGRCEFVPHLWDHPGARVSQAFQQRQHRHHAAEGHCGMSTKHGPLAVTAARRCALLKASECLQTEE